MRCTFFLTIILQDCTFFDKPFSGSYESKNEERKYWNRKKEKDEEEEEQGKSIIKHPKFY